MGKTILTSGGAGFIGGRDLPSKGEGGGLEALRRGSRKALRRPAG